SGRSAGRSIASSAIRSSLPKLTALMLSRFGRTHPGLIAGILALVRCLAAIALMPGDWRNVFRERAFDIVLAADRQIRGSNPERNPAGPPVVVCAMHRRRPARPRQRP